MSRRLHFPCYTRFPEKQRARLGKSVLPVKIFVRLCLTDKRNGAVELCLGGLLAGIAAATPNLTRAGIARYNSFQGPYLSGKPVIDGRLVRRIDILTRVVSGKNRSGPVRQNCYRASQQAHETRFYWTIEIAGLLTIFTCKTWPGIFPEVLCSV